MHVEVYTNWAIADARKVVTVLNGVRDTIPQAKEYCEDTEPIIEQALGALINLKEIIERHPFLPEHTESQMYRYVDSVRVTINELRFELGAP